ncbi:hypothetical protein DW657_17125 [Prevotella sp. AM23-5]|nr:hypothetical protein DW657_17125 [Prevotella sp. AM23-5]
MVMIDDKKIRTAAVKSTNYLKGICDFTVINASEEGFKTGAKWAINELLKDLSHPASEVPRNDNGKILAFSKVNSNIKLYDMNAMLNETACDTYQEMWEIRVRIYTFTDWVFVDELLDLITKGGEQ